MFAGDSCIGEDEAAVADTAPRTKRETRPEQNYVKSAVMGKRGTSDDEHAGNVGWLFGNWGKRPRNPDMREHLEMALKMNPAMVIGFAECDRESEELLRAPGCSGNEHAPKGSLHARYSFAYLTLRGAEGSSVLIGVRERMGNALELLCWEATRGDLPTPQWQQR